MNTTYNNLDEATTALLSYAPAERPKSYNLSTMKRLMAILGNPEQSLKVIHVAGTSGKTSTSYYIRGLLEAAGQKTGLTVSPHITDINERVQIHGVPLEASSFLKYFEEFINIIQATDILPSYYELTMALAYFVFAKEAVDYAVIETGLGGLLDGSNVAERGDKICVIQRIGYDHTEILGETLPEIALQKAGIIHDNNTVFVLEQPHDIDEVIAAYAKQKNATLYRVSETVWPDIPVAYQHANWSMAYAVYRYLVEQEGIPELEPEAMRKLKQQTPPGRYEMKQYKDKTIIFDGAHNGQKLLALMKSMDEKGINLPVIILSLKKTDDKKIDECMAAVAGHCSELILTTFYLGQDSRFITNTDTGTMQQYAAKHGINTTIIDDQRAALEKATNSESRTVLVTGSLYLVSEMRKLIAD